MALIVADEHYENRVLINNDAGCLSQVLIEPWGEEVSLESGDQLLVVGRGPEDGRIIKFEYAADVLTIYAWPGSTLTFTLNDSVLITASSSIAAF